MDEEEKYLFLKEFITDETAIHELLKYTENKFKLKNNSSSQIEGSYLNTWEDYFQESKEKGAFETIKKYLVQLQFPVEKGISKTEEYINSTLKGKKKISKSCLVLNQPKLIKLELDENNMFGKVPVLIVPNDEDFNTIVCALFYKNESVSLPKSMGAIFINGINNWDRINRLKSDWLKNNHIANWNHYFKMSILPNPSLFKDKIIVLSKKYYSGIKSDSLGFSDKIWRLLSFRIRREHEFVHFFTLNYYGHMDINIHDEIIADYAGITSVLGIFNKDWFLRFIGLEDYPKYRKGGRLENYLGHNKMSEAAFEGLKIIIKDATDSIFRFDQTLGKLKTPTDQLSRIKSICEIDLITIASPSGEKKLIDKYNKINVRTIL